MKKIHEYFDKVFVINLEVAKDRFFVTQNNLGKSLGTEYEIFVADDGSLVENLPMNDINSKMEGWTKGAYALKMTTIKLLKEAKKRGYENILICEDDLFFNFHALEKIGDSIKRIPKDWELIHFATSNIIPPEYVSGRVYKIKKAWSCQMYAVNSRIFDLYIDLLTNNEYPIDYITSEFIHCRDKSYSIEPSIVVTNPNYSYVRRKFVNYQ